MAKKYYDKLFKEYCICDLSRYKENKVICPNIMFAQNLAICFVTEWVVVAKL